MRTTDSPEKVIAWYTDRLKPTEIVNRPEGPAILKKGGTTVIITADGEGANIMVAGRSGEE